MVFNYHLMLLLLSSMQLAYNSLEENNKSCPQNFRFDHNLQECVSITVCSEGYELDINGKCGPISDLKDNKCNADKTCKVDNQFCYENKYCKCKPNYYYNKINDKCEIGHCNNDYDCHKSDKNRVCHKNMRTCRCKKGYTRLIGDENGLCQEMSCKSDIDCHLNGMVCLKNKCKCNKHFTFDEKLGKCLTNRSLYGEFCLNDSSCYDGLSSIGAMICNNKECKCAPNYQLSKTTTKQDICQLYRCKTDKDCHSYDQKRYCSKKHKQCTCYTGYEEDLNNGRKCIKSDNYKNVNSTLYIWYIICFIIPLLFVLLAFIAFLSYSLKQNFSTTMTTTNRNNPVNNINNNKDSNSFEIIEHSTTVPTDDKPPSYTTFQPPVYDNYVTTNLANI